MEFTKRDPFVNSSNKVVSLLIAAKEVDGEYSADIEKTYTLTAAEQKLLPDWTEAEVVTICNTFATEQGWQAILDADIAAQKEEKPEPAYFYFWDGGDSAIRD